MKSIYRLGLFSILFIGLFPIGCNRGCREPMGFSRLPDNISVQFWNTSGFTDTLHFSFGGQKDFILNMRIGGERKFIVQNESHSNFIVQSAYADDCPPDYFIEFSPGLQKLSVRCDKAISNHLPNSELNDLFKSLVDSRSGPGVDTLSFDQLNDSLLSKTSPVRKLENHTFICQQEIPQGVYQFTFEVKLNDGSILEGLSPWIAID